MITYDQKNFQLFFFQDKIDEKMYAPWELK